MRIVRLCVAACLMLAAGIVFAADQKQMSVTVKETPVRATPSYLGKILGTLKYADRVTVLDQPAGTPKGWLKVRGPDGKLQGWVSLSALQEKTIALKSGTEDVAQGAATGEVALATKGFTEEVEKEYKQENKLDYTWVDRMEKFVVTSDQLTAFITQGGLLSAEGGAR
jgi:uncharacterized protein YgiM (DUF1202 family)